MASSTGWSANNNNNHIYPRSNKEGEQTRFYLKTVIWQTIITLDMQAE